jgi:hypothetical protein
MNELQTLQTEARAEFYEKCGHVISTSSPSNFSAVNESIDSLTRRAYLLGVEECEKVMPAYRNATKGQMEPEDYYENSGYNCCLREALTRLSEVKKNI